MTNWRLLEDEIIDILRREGFTLDENRDGDKIIDVDKSPELNISIFARKLAERLDMKPKTAKVTQ